MQKVHASLNKSVWKADSSLPRAFWLDFKATQKIIDREKEWDHMELHKRVVKCPHPMCLKGDADLGALKLFT